MIREFLTLGIIFIFGVGLACQTATAPSNSNSANTANAVMKPIDNNNIPPEFSGKPLEMNGTTPTPGIPDPKNMNINSVPKGTTPTPGIPDPKTAGKSLPKGATPTPGIPDPESIKKQMSNRVNPDAVNAPSNK